MHSRARRPGAAQRVHRAESARPGHASGPTLLKYYAKTGDLRDCGKVVVETDGHPEYRIVVREVGGSIEIIEIVTLEERADDLAYLLAGVRPGRITDRIRRSETDRKIARIQKLRSESNPPPSTPTKRPNTSP